MRYHIAEKEVLALLRVLSTFYTIVAGSPVKVNTRYSVLKWLMTSKSVTGRCLQWATLLSPWTLEIQRIEKMRVAHQGRRATKLLPRPPRRNPTLNQQRQRLYLLVEALVPLPRPPRRNPTLNQQRQRLHVLVEAHVLVLWPPRRHPTLNRQLPLLLL
ncbi:hypothetical protein P43SY_011057 [Pythium insidiosum]|uniref:Reverse transcriptase RNase H-like domain-containing protein n=1 Tax=Pythium insidiosum TaxID=114742 RepID=A0AAD5L735_PYTIN|nr:hypothetical protein P43SY_011057 [Pythium insidiosum]